MNVLRRGVDSYRHLGGADARAAALGFWLRYFGGSADKQLVAAEVADAHTHGVDVGLNWEVDASDGSGGYAQGQRYATAANDEADALGAPQDGSVWIWYSVDSGRSADWVRPYFQGIASVGRRPAGGYGGTEIRQMKREGLSRGWWQANAGSWSGWGTSNFPSDPEADLRQIIGGYLPGTDGNNQYSADCGFWLADPHGPKPLHLPPLPPLENDMPTVVVADVVLNPANPAMGYTMDAQGGCHAFGGAVPILAAPDPARPDAVVAGYWHDSGPARKLFIFNWARPSGMIVDSLGRPQGFGGFTPPADMPVWEHAFIPPLPVTELPK